MIVTLVFPSNINVVKYGISEMLLVDQKIDVPEYVAKTLLSLPGVTGPAITGTTSDLLGDLTGTDVYETVYLFTAWGLAPMFSNQVPQALALLTARGEPVVSMN